MLLAVLALSACSAPAVVADGPAAFGQLVGGGPAGAPTVPSVAAVLPSSTTVDPPPGGPGGHGAPADPAPVTPTAAPTPTSTPAVTPAGTPAVGEPTSAPTDPDDPVDSAPTVADPAGAVWCPWVALSLTSPLDGGSVPAGRTTITGTSDELQGRQLSWSVTNGQGATTTGMTTRGAGGTFAFPVDLTVGTYRVTVGVEAPSDSTGSSWVLCRQVGASVTVTPALATWASGASGDGVAAGRFASWRGSPVTVAGTWADSNAGQTGLWSIRPGAEFGQWAGDLDIAIGAIDAGETWAAAARGAYDARWTQSLQEMAGLWAGRPGTLYIRFAHEFNGNWYPWQVTAATAGDFRTSWQRFRALQQRWFPAARLVFCPSADTQGANGLDWRTAFPGAAYVDVVSVDYYNMYPWVDTAADFQRTAQSYDRWGAPRGIQRHLEFARSVGLPFAVSEWGNNGDFGDSPVFMEQMHAFFAANAGSGPGQLRYEVLFNVVWSGSNPYALTPSSRSPRAAAAYQRLF